uniref:2-oxoglutarate-dependent ethylene/succinate-forming enzyme n=1 Tax=Candidatus Kentrum sp. UNK TaxID=2126344 RepID=A0A451AQS3_9GAMM|nr:MAG: Isopenicillin N synthase [Candidatus Kentron sp. UNK]VFK73612.1 MAG: Isopenicillin N synthase [Candidatus Kentron sp. UNK]
MLIPNIDFSSYNEARPETLLELGRQVYAALSAGGFMTVTNIGVEHKLRNRIFDISKSFFNTPLEEKFKFSYMGAKEDFGYQGLLEEHLDPGTPADLKEIFTMRNVRRHLENDTRWPSLEFKETVLEFYESCLKGTFKIQRVFSAILEKEKDFFVNAHSGSNTTMRMLYYPKHGTDIDNRNHLGAGAHTDYGMITLLFQDDVAGLEVKDKEGVWQPVEPDKNKIVINIGDLMERWTNGVFRSTPHRVQSKLGDEDRYSIAIFVNPDNDTVIETLDSCITESKPDQFKPVTANEYILEKIKATHGRVY